MSGGTALVVDGREVARYRVHDHLAPELGRRPFLHPVRTLAGVPVTASGPDDHPWHLGLSVAVPDVDGSNFWGGPTYRPGEGYRERADHGEIRHRRWHRCTGSAAHHDLIWSARSGEALIHEHRRITAEPAEGGWLLTLTTRLHNATARPLQLSGPGAAGRAGAGYGGIFWRLPEGPVTVHSPHADGEEELNGATAPWLRVRTREAELVLRSVGDDPWFVRTSAYPGVGTAFCATEPLHLPSAGSIRRGLQATILDVPDQKSGLADLS